MLLPAIARPNPKLPGADVEPLLSVVIPYLSAAPYSVPLPRAPVIGGGNHLIAPARCVDHRAARKVDA